MDQAFRDKLARAMIAAVDRPDEDVDVVVDVADLAPHLCLADHQRPCPEAQAKRDLLLRCLHARTLKVNQ